MQRFLILMLVCLLALRPSWAQEQGRWKMYLAYHDNTCNVVGNDGVYALYNHNLLAYDPATQAVKTFSRIDGLHGKNIERMVYAPTYACLFLLYDDGNIDLLYDNGNVVNLPAYAQSPEKNLKWTDVVVNGRWVTATTDTGFLLVDLAKQEIRSYYEMGRPIGSVIATDQELFAMFGPYCYRCSIYANLLDNKNWKLVDQVSAFQLRIFGGYLWCFTYQGAWTYRLTADKPVPTGNQVTTTCRPDQIVIAEGKMLLRKDNHLELFTTAHPLQVAQTYDIPQEWQCISPASTHGFWVSLGTRGLAHYTWKAGTWTQDGTPLNNYGPSADMCYSMHFCGDTLLVAGGFNDYTGKIHAPVAYSYVQGKWYNFPTEEAMKQTGTPFYNVTAIAQDPADPHHHYIAANTGLYEFKNMKFVRRYDHYNSPLQSILPNDPHSREYVRLDGLAYDHQRNLWMVNNETDTLLRILLPNGTWRSYNVPDLKRAPTMEKMLIDRQGRLWATSRRTVSYHQSGVFCLDFNNTLTRLSDDNYVYCTYATNEDGRGVAIGGEYGQVFALAEDQDGYIWIGTNIGVFVVTEPEAWLHRNFKVVQPKVPRNDGTNYADYLLNNVAVSALAVDGGNRKWIGTYGSGVYLVSPDGTQILEHFTTQNTPILSDNIYSLAVHPQTGEVMIGTDLGLCAYESGVSEPQPTLSKHHLRIYPNPVTPDYQGQVTITGLSDNAYIRIAKYSGQVVAGGRSTGGTFLWDACGPDGRRVGSGVYNVFISDAQGKKGIAGKIVVI